MSSSERDIANAIRSQVRQQAALDVANEDLAGRVKDSVQEFWPKPGPGHPYATGESVGSVHVEKTPSRNGLPARRVRSDSRLASIIEYGSGPDANRDPEAPGGPNTPTPAFAPFGKTQVRFADELGQ